MTGLLSKLCTVFLLLQDEPLSRPLITARSPEAICQTSRLAFKRALVLPLLVSPQVEGLGGVGKGVTLQASPCFLTQSNMNLDKAESLALPL